MKTFFWLLAVSILCCLSGFGQFAVTSNAIADDKPNVIIVMTDDQGYGDLACHGNPILKTPNLDRLSTDAVRFTDFHVSPFCTPTRASLMTGNHAGYTGAFRTSSGRTMMHPDEKTVADLFSDAGYVTGMVGKWHLGDNAPHRPQDRGFQDVVWHRCGGIGQASDYWGNDYSDDTYERNGKFEKFEGYCTDVWFREGMRFIEENQSKPFMLYLATNAPHGPYRVPKEWAKPYAGNSDVVNPNFYGMIANVDHNMGLLRDQLTKLGLADNTILIFMTDNGTSAGGKFKGLDSEPSRGFNAGMRGKKSSVYDGGHRVPFFIHWPNGNLIGGKDIANLAAHIDVLPTLADLCGIPVPDGYQPDGISLKPLLKEGDQPWTRSHLVEQFHGGAYAKSFPPMAYDYSVVMTERWRLVNSDDELLFDIQVDPAQRTNVADKHPQIVAQLRSQYDQFWKKVSPRLTPVRIDVGNPADNPTVLCSQDWRMPNGNPPWNFNSIKKLPKVTGPWMLNVKQAGRYRITLRQYPKEANKPVVAERAKIDIAGQTLELPVVAGSKGVVFETNLPQGPTELVTYLYDKNGKAGGAYFTEVEARDNVVSYQDAAAEPQTTSPKPKNDTSKNSFDMSPWDIEGADPRQGKKLVFDALREKVVTPNGNGWRHELKIKASLRMAMTDVFEDFSAKVKLELSKGSKTIIAQHHAGDTGTIFKLYVSDSKETGFLDSKPNNGIFDVYVRLARADGSGEEKRAMGTIKTGDSFNFRVINDKGLVTVKLFGKTFKLKVKDDSKSYLKFGNYLQAQNTTTMRKVKNSDDWPDFYRDAGITESVVTFSNVKYVRVPKNPNQAKK